MTTLLTDEAYETLERTDAIVKAAAEIDETLLTIGWIIDEDPTTLQTLDRLLSAANRAVADLRQGAQDIARKHRK